MIDPVIQSTRAVREQANLLQNACLGQATNTATMLHRAFDPTITPKLSAAEEASIALLRLVKR